LVGAGVFTVAAASAIPAAKPLETVAQTPAKPAAPKARHRASLLSAATPEERERLTEERKRLSAAAATGTDPTAIIGFYQLAYGHSAYTHGLSTNVGSAVVRLPLTPNWVFQLSMPYVWADLNRPQASFRANGTSDMLLRTGGRLYDSELIDLFAGLDATLPTASDQRLGTGHYTLGPGIAAAAPLPRLQSLGFLLLADYNSVDSVARRPDLHYLWIEPRFNTFWSEHWWTLVSGSWAIDWNNRRANTLNLTGQVGYRVDQDWNVFAGAGGGVVGQDTFLGLDWNVQVGVRWVFGTPLIPETLFSGPLTSR
jgi:hypothetical protein